MSKNCNTIDLRGAQVNEADKKSVENSLKSAKAHYEEKLSHQVGKNHKRFWNYTRHFSRSSQTVDTLESGTSQVTIDSEKAEILNEHFAESQTVEDSDLQYHTVIHLSFIRYRGLILPGKNIMLHLKPNKANGPDNISINILKFCPAFAAPLYSLYNQSIQTGTMPQDWEEVNDH